MLSGPANPCGENEHAPNGIAGCASLLALIRNLVLRTEFFPSERFTCSHKARRTYCRTAASTGGETNSAPCVLWDLRTGSGPNTHDGERTSLTSRALVILGVSSSVSLQAKGNDSIDFDGEPMRGEVRLVGTANKPTSSTSIYSVCRSFTRWLRDGYSFQRLRYRCNFEARGEWSPRWSARAPARWLIDTGERTEAFQ